MPGCNKLYKCGSQKISKQCTFVAGRLKTAVLLQKPWFTAFLSRMSRKTQHTRFEDKILRKLANEDKPQVVTACFWIFEICKTPQNIHIDNNLMLYLCSEYCVFCDCYATRCLQSKERQKTKEKSFVYQARPKAVFQEHKNSQICILDGKFKVLSLTLAWVSNKRHQRCW